MPERADPFVRAVGGRMIDTVVHDAGTRAVLVVGVRYPLPEGDPLVPGRLYREWLRSVFMRVFLPLFL